MTVAARDAHARAPWQAVAAALLDGLRDAAWLVDAGSLRVLAANPAAERMFGARRDGLAGRPVLELAATPEDQVFWGEVAAGCATAAAEGLDSETVLCPAGGDAPCPVRRSISPLRLPAGERCFLVQVQDRSAQRRAEAEQAQRVALLRATLEATADGILVTDLAGRIVNFNQRFAVLWALPDELRQRGDDDAVLAWLQRSVVDPGAYMRRLALIDDASAEPACDTLTLVGGRRIERVSLPQRSEGATVGRVWSFREAAVAGA